MTHYRLSALMKTVERRDEEASTVSLFFLVQLLRAQGRSRVGFEGCPPGQAIATSKIEVPNAPYDRVMEAAEKAKKQFVSAC